MAKSETIELRDMTLDEAASAQSEKRQALGKKVLAMYDEARSNDTVLNEQRQDWYRWYVGDQWAKKRPTWLSDPVINVILPAIEATVGILTAQYPRFQVRPGTMENPEEGKNWNDRLEFWWFENQMDRLGQDWVKNGVKYGAGILGLTLRKNNGKAAILPAVIDPWDFHLEPLAPTVQASRYAIYTGWMNVEEVEELYGVRLGSDGGFIEDPHAARAKETPLYHEGIGGQPPWRTSDETSGARRSVRGKIRVIECWWDDPSSERIPLEERQQEATAENERMAKEPVGVDPYQDHKTHREIHQLAIQGQETAIEAVEDEAQLIQLAEGIYRLKEHVGKHKTFEDDGFEYSDRRVLYPKGRHTVIAESGYVLFDGPNRYGFKPFVIYPFVRLSNQTYGLGIPPMVEKLQKNINVLAARCIDSANLAARPILIYSTASGIDPDQLLVMPNAKWPVAMMAEMPEFLRTNVIPFDKVQAFVDHLMFACDIITGTHDIMQGRMPAGARTSGRAIGRLQEFGMKRMTQCIKDYCGALREVGAMLVEIMQANFDEQETFPREAMRYMSRPYEQVNYVKDFRAADYRGTRYFVGVELNALMPGDALQTRDDALLLHGKQVIDDEALLDALNFPNRAEVLGRMKASLQAAGLARSMPGGLPGQEQGPMAMMPTAPTAETRPG